MLDAFDARASLELVRPTQSALPWNSCSSTPVSPCATCDGDLQQLLNSVEVGGYSTEMAAIERGERSEMVPVTWVTPEVLRLAVGARSGDIYRLVLHQGVVLALGGLLLGIPAALGLTRLVESLLYGVSPTQPEAFLRTALLLLLAAVSASLVPARRATEVDPIEVLHSD